jgi:hypothetical protein
MYFYPMNNTTKGSREGLFYTPENVGGGCMTGKVSTNPEVKEISSYIADYKKKKVVKKAKKRRFSLKRIPA